MTQGMRKVLVIHASSSGCTQTIARRIATVLIGQGIRPQVASADDGIDVDESYAGVIFGSGVRVGRWHKEGIDWLEKNLPRLNGRPFVAFSVGLQGVESVGKRDQALADHERCMRSFAPYQSIAGEVFPGWKQTEGFSRVEKLALKVYPLEDGDYRDWDAVDAWVREIAPLFK